MGPENTREARRPTVLVVEDDVLVRTAVINILSEAQFKVIPVVDAGEALQVMHAPMPVDAVVTDVVLPGTMHGIELARKVLGELVVSARPLPLLEELPVGALFVAKPVHPPTLVRLVHQLIGQQEDRENQNPLPLRRSRTAAELTPRQKEVLSLLVQGKSNRDIAEALALSEHTVKVHLAAIFRVIGVSNRTEAAISGARLLRIDQ